MLRLSQYPELAPPTETDELGPKFQKHKSIACVSFYDGRKYVKLHQSIFLNYFKAHLDGVSLCLLNFKLCNKLRGICSESSRPIPMMVKEFRWTIKSNQLEDLQRGATIYSEAFFLHDTLLESWHDDCIDCTMCDMTSDSNNCSKWKIQAHLNADILHLQLVWLEHSGGNIPQETPDKVSFRFTAYSDTEYGKVLVARFPRLPFDVKSYSLDLQRLCLQEDEAAGCSKEERNHKTNAKPPGDVSFLCMQYKNFHYCEFNRSKTQASNYVPRKVDRHWPSGNPSNPICLEMYPRDSLHIGPSNSSRLYPSIRIYPRDSLHIGVNIRASYKDKPMDEGILEQDIPQVAFWYEQE